MLQTVPDTPTNMCAEVDIFDGFGNAGMGIPSNFPGMNGSGTSGEFKMEDQSEYGRPNPNLPPFDNRIEELGSPSNGQEGGDNSPFTSPPIIPSAMEFPGFGDYGGFADLGSGINNNLTPSNLGNFGEGVGGGGRQVEFKREFEGGLGLGHGLGSQGMGGGGVGNGHIVRRPPLRQDSGSSFAMQIPRSVPDQHFHQQVQRTNSGGESVEMGMARGNDLPFR